MTSPFNFGTNVIPNKTAYNPSNKLTYNFVTDPRLRRGHNFGVVYVTSSNFNEQNQNQKNQLPSIKKRSNRTYSNNFPMDKTQLSKAYSHPNKNIKNVNYDGFGIFTEKVTTTEMPKPITFEEIIQTDPLPPKPQEPLIWPEKTGIDVETQIEDGDLFNFDIEVEPLVHIILSKTLEESRREVLEEEEIREMKEQQEKYKNINLEDSNRVKEIENNEKKRYDDMRMKKENKIKRLNMTKMFQQKLTCRTIAKKYISRLLSNTKDSLTERAVFKNPQNNDFFTDLLPDLQDLAENYSLNDYKVVDNLQKMLTYKYLKNNKEKHKNAILKEKERLQENKRIAEILKKREEDEIRRKKEERARRKHEKILNAIRSKLKVELVKKSEWLENGIDAIYDINGYYQKENNVTTIGGPIGQFALYLEMINKLIPDFLTDEKIKKIIEVYIEKSHPIFFVYKNEDLEKYKEIDEGIETIEDIIKPEDENKYKQILDIFYENTFTNDDMLNYFFDICNEIGLDKVKDTYKKIFYLLINKFKEGTDFGVVKFIQRDLSFDEIPLECICLLIQEVFPIDNPNKKEVKKNPMASSSIGSSALKKALEKKKKEEKEKAKPQNFEHFYCEKTLMMPTVSDNLKIICINKNFDRVFRTNFLDCVDFIYKFEDDKDNIYNTLNDDYGKFISGLLLKLAGIYQKEIVEMQVGMPKDDEEEEEEENKD